MFIRKIVIAAFLICVIVVSFSAFTSASVSNPNARMPDDFDEARVAASIVSRMNDAFHAELIREMTVDDVDFSRAYRIYLSNVFEMRTTSFDSMVELLEKGIMIFEVPVTIGDYTFVANVQIINPMTEAAARLLTQDQIDLHNSIAGTWDVSAIHLFSSDYPFESYYDIASEISGARGGSERPVLVGGLPGFRLPVAIYPDSAGNIASIVPTAPEFVNWNALGFDELATGRGDIDLVLDFQDIRERALAIPPPEAELSGGGGGHGAQTDGRANGQVSLMLILAVAMGAIFVKVLSQKIRSASN